VVSFTPWPLYRLERGPGTYCIGGWVEPRTGLNDMEKRKFLTLPGLEFRPLGRPANSQSLYRLRYPGSLPLKATNKIIYRNVFKFWTDNDKGMVKVSIAKEFFFIYFISFSSWSIIQNPFRDMILYENYKPIA
jgi:hypothetical protein